MFALGKPYLLLVMNKNFPSFPRERSWREWCVLPELGCPGISEGADTSLQGSGPRSEALGVLTLWSPLVPTHQGCSSACRDAGAGARGSEHTPGRMCFVSCGPGTWDGWGVVLLAELAISWPL